MLCDISVCSCTLSYAIVCYRVLSYVIATYGLSLPRPRIYRQMTLGSNIIRKEFKRLNNCEASATQRRTAVQPSGTLEERRGAKVEQTREKRKQAEAQVICSPMRVVRPSIQ